MGNEDKTTKGFAKFFLGYFTVLFLIASCKN